MKLLALCVLLLGVSAAAQAVSPASPRPFSEPAMDRTLGARRPFYETLIQPLQQPILATPDAKIDIPSVPAMPARQQMGQEQPKAADATIPTFEDFKRAALAYVQALTLLKQDIPLELQKEPTMLDYQQYLQASKKQVAAAKGSLLQDQAKKPLQSMTLEEAQKVHPEISELELMEMKDALSEVEAELSRPSEDFSVAGRRGFGWGGFGWGFPGFGFGFPHFGWGFGFPVGGFGFGFPGYGFGHRFHKFGWGWGW